MSQVAAHTQFPVVLQPVCVDPMPGCTLQAVAHVRACVWGMQLGVGAFDHWSEQVACG